jgi:hypothetical protein
MTDMHNLATDNEAIRLWTVYDRPYDFPNSYVARLFEVRFPGGELRKTASIMVCPDLEQLRGHLLEMGLYCMKRQQGDDPCIVETWI